MAEARNSEVMSEKFKKDSIYEYIEEIHSSQEYNNNNNNNNNNKNNVT
jgi:hypothetical protein